jgi:hypothetical protein
LTASPWQQQGDQIGCLLPIGLILEAFWQCLESPKKCDILGYFLLNQKFTFSPRYVVSKHVLLYIYFKVLKVYTFFTFKFEISYRKFDIFWPGSYFGYFSKNFGQTFPHHLVTLANSQMGVLIVY